MTRGTGLSVREKSLIVGRTNERRVLQALEGRVGNPSWLLAVRMATSKEDAVGIDIVCTLENGHMAYIQVKSSELGAGRFSDRFKLLDLNVLPMMIYVARSLASEQRIGDDLIEALDGLRQRTMRIQPERCWHWLEDMYRINQEAMREHYHSDAQAATLWAEVLNNGSLVQGDYVWVQQAVVQRRGYGLGNSGLVLLKTAGGYNMFLKVVGQEREARGLRNMIDHTVFRGSVIVTSPINVQDPYALPEIVASWRQQYYESWCRKVERNR